MAGIPDETLPAYVLRDVDEAADGVRARLAAAAAKGGFVLLVGDSSVGKTRTAYEAVRGAAGLVAGPPGRRGGGCGAGRASAEPTRDLAR